MHEELNQISICFFLHVWFFFFVFFENKTLTTSDPFVEKCDLLLLNTFPFMEVYMKTIHVLLSSHITVSSEPRLYNPIRPELLVNKFLYNVKDTCIKALSMSKKRKIFSKEKLKHHYEKWFRNINNSLRCKPMQSKFK